MSIIVTDFISSHSSVVLKMYSKTGCCFKSKDNWILQETIVLILKYQQEWLSVPHSFGLIPPVEKMILGFYMITCFL